VFERLGVFPGDFDAPAAEAVVRGAGIEGWDVVEALTSLVAKSMLVADRSPAGSTRYQMLETLRHYARERLDISGSSDDRRRRHARYYAGFAEEGGRGLQGAEEQRWHERILADLDNFRAAVSWGFDSRDDEDAELAMCIIANLAYGGWGNWNAGLGAWAEEALAHRDRWGEPRYHGTVLAAASANAFYRGDFDLGRQLAGEAVEAGAVEGSPFPYMPYSVMTVFERPEALPHVLASGLDGLQRVNAPEWETASLRVAVAAMAAVGGQMELAKAEATLALAVGRRLTSPSIVATALYAYALACSQSQPAEALAALDEFFTVARGGLGSQVLARCLALGSQLRSAAGDFPGAFIELRQAIEMAHGHGDRPAMAFTLARAVSVLRRDDPTTAGVLSGVIGGGVLGRQFPVLRWEREWYQEVTEEIRSVLGEGKYHAAVDLGISLSYDDAVMTALTSIGALPD
jgi:hypothetical protein